jgi:Fe2+ or Zn2+ uptake regulation protein
MAECISHCLLTEEKGQILWYADEHPEQHHREIHFNLARYEIASVSASSVYRTLKAKKLVKEHRVLKPKEVYRQEYTDHLDARDSLSRFF